MVVPAQLTRRIGAWRPRPELNRGTRFCRPLRNHSATWPKVLSSLKKGFALVNTKLAVATALLPNALNRACLLAVRRASSTFSGRVVLPVRSDMAVQIERAPDGRARNRCAVAPGLQRASWELASSRLAARRMWGAARIVVGTYSEGAGRLTTAPRKCLRIGPASRRRGSPLSLQNQRTARERRLVRSGPRRKRAPCHGETQGKTPCVTTAWATARAAAPTSRSRSRSGIAPALRLGESRRDRPRDPRTGLVRIRPPWVTSVTRPRPSTEGLLRAFATEPSWSPAR
jgi:hypothetical protein